MNHVSSKSACAVGALVALHSTPTLAIFAPLGTRLAPRLVGIGSPEHVALTFDDGPDSSSTPFILDALDAAGCHATFFLLGSMVDSAPEVVRRMVESGHEIGVHGDRHSTVLTRSPMAVREDLHSAVAKIRQVSGHQPHWFRPPYGHLSISAWRTARSLKLRTILWTAWGRDWRAQATPKSIIADIERGTVEAGTILLHDSDCTSAQGSWRNTADALPQLIARLRSSGLTPGPLRDHWTAGAPVGRPSSRS